jgi:uncharacterized protein (TIGR02597 family)
MTLFHMKLLRYSLITPIAFTVCLSVANSQTTATTDPVGFTTINVRGKTTTARAVTFVVLPMEQASAYASSFAGANFTTESNRSVITFGSNVFTANQFTGTGNQHYLRITSGANSGDFSTVFANTANSLTLADNFSAVLTTNTTFEIIPYWTLNTALPNGGGLNGGGNASVADTVTLYNASFVGTTYFYNTTLSRWQTGGTSAVNTIIPPGVGLAIERKQVAAVSIALPGTVPLGTSAVSVSGSTSGSATRNTLVGSAYPLASKTLADIGLTQGGTNPAVGLIGAGNASQADTITIFNPVSGGQTVYFYNTTLNRWQTGGTSANTVTIPEGSAILIARKSGRPPFTWYIPQPTMALQ